MVMPGVMPGRAWLFLECPEEVRPELWAGTLGVVPAE